MPDERSDPQGINPEMGLRAEVIGEPWTGVRMPATPSQVACKSILDSIFLASSEGSSRKSSSPRGKLR